MPIEFIDETLESDAHQRPHLGGRIKQRLKSRRKVQEKGETLIEKITRLIDFF